MQTLKVGLISSLAAVAAASQAFTMATFADPSTDGSTPLFTWTTTSISGGWSGTGLTLQTPGWGIPDLPNAKFLMSPVATVAMGGGLYSAGPGVIHFSDALNNTVLDITFQSGFLSIYGFGASDFVGNGVTYSGSGVPTGTTDNSFSFSFANQHLGATNTATASFTSSAVPEPASFLAIGLGLACLVARRRKN